MLSYSKIKSAGSAAAYFAKYYAEPGREGEGEPPGKWYGPAAESLGLRGDVDKKDLEALLRGVDPKSGEQLGKIQKNHVPGHDLTFSAPKSVSTVWAVGDDSLRAEIESRHESAVRSAMDYLSKEAIKARMGAGGKELADCSPVMATFQHSTSRQNDPQLHTHAVVANAARMEDGSWRRVDIDLRAIHTAGAIYRAELARQLREVGFDIETGKRGTFELRHVPQALRDDWSKRRGEVRAELAERGRFDAATANAAAAASRASKENPNRAENFARWREEARAHDFEHGRVQQLRRGFGLSGSAMHPEPAKTDAELLAGAMGNRAAISREELRRHVMQEAVGRTTAAEALARAERIEAGMVVVEKQTARGNQQRLTTAVYLERERQIVADGKALAESKRHALPAAAIERQIAAGKLEGQQADMVRSLTDGRGCAVVQGWAGTGKTYTVKQVAELYKSAGYDVRGCAVAGKAAEGLREAGIESDTIARLRMDLASGEAQLTSRTVIVMDEAGMTGAADMADLMRRAREADAKVILMGDDKQLAPIEAGRPFEDLGKQLGRFELSDVRRQKEQTDKDIARAIREGRAAEAVAAMKARGQWHVAERVGDAGRAMAKDYAERRAAGYDSLMLADKRSDVAKLNEAARAELKAAGLIRGREVEIDTADGRKAYAAGDRIMFQTNERELGLRNGQRGEVVAVTDRELQIRMAEGKNAGKTLSFPILSPEQLEKIKARTEATEKRVEALEKERRALAPTALERAARAVGAAKLTPAEAQAKAAQMEQIKAQLTEAREQRELQRLAQRIAEAQHGALANATHGHAVTVHKSQGVTVKAPTAEQLAKMDPAAVQKYGRGGDVLRLARDSHMATKEAEYVGASRNEGRAHYYLAAKEEAGVVAGMERAARVESLRDWSEASPGQQADKAAQQPQQAKPEPQQAQQQERQPERIEAAREAIERISRSDDPRRELDGVMLAADLETVEELRARGDTPTAESQLAAIERSIEQHIEQQHQHEQQPEQRHGEQQHEAPAAAPARSVEFDFSHER